MDQLIYWAGAPNHPRTRGCTDGIPKVPEYNTGTTDHPENGESW